ncbi:MAG: ABC transporter substrate-binding protein [Rhodocyclaceae bacterium]|nr:ABC transporter substrate-binding protein [Rhodocyclaceae bacterium]
MFLIRQVSRLLLPLVLLLAATAAVAAEKQPVYVGLDAELEYAGSTSAQAIRMGMLIAMEEINRAGGVLGGRPLQLVERDNKSLPARSLANLKELAANPDLVAVFCGRFSPTVLESLPLIHELKLPLLDPWGSADGIIDNGYAPNYVFRLSLRDSWAMPTMLRHAQKKGAQRVGLLLLNTSWGRSNLKAAETYATAHPEIKIVGTQWYNWADKSFLDKYAALKQAGAQAIAFVANHDEAGRLVREMAAMPKAERLPIVSHWGVSGGDFAEDAGPALQEVDYAVVQTYSFIGANTPKAKQVLAAAQRMFGVKDARSLPAPVGVAHAYDLTHILARAIDRAGSTERAAVRDALEQVRDYAGLIKRYPQPFTSERHEALSPEDVFMARYAADGAIVRIADR